MKFQLDERGFILAEFAIALPLLILLLGALGMITVNAMKISREQSADYTLETEAQHVINRITSDARSAQKVEVRKAIASSNQKEDGKLYSVMFTYETIDSKRIGIDVYDDSGGKSDARGYKNILESRLYTIGSNRTVNAKRRETDTKSNPITGGNSFGNTVVTELNFSEPSKNVLHITLEMQSLATNQKVRLSTSVFMPACEEIDIKYE